MNLYCNKPKKLCILYFYFFDTYKPYIHFNNTSIIKIWENNFILEYSAVKTIFGNFVSILYKKRFSVNNSYLNLNQKVSNKILSIHFIYYWFFCPKVCGPLLDVCPKPDVILKIYHDGGNDLSCRFHYTYITSKYCLISIIPAWNSSKCTFKWNLFLNKFSKQLFCEILWLYITVLLLSFNKSDPTMTIYLLQWCKLTSGRNTRIDKWLS